MDTNLQEYLPLTRWIARKIAYERGSLKDLDDLSQIGVLGLIEAAERYDASKGGSFKTYAEYRIRGTILDQLRTNKRQFFPISLQEEEPDGSTEGEFSDSLEERELRSSIKTALRQLTPREQSVVQLYYYEDLNLKEIGEKLRVSESRVSQLHGSALRKLGKTLKKEGLA